MEGFWEDGVWSCSPLLISGLSWHARWQLSLTAGHTGQTSWRHFQPVFAFPWHEIQIVSVYKLILCEIFFFFEHNLIHLTHLCTVKMYLIEPFLQSAESILEEDSCQRCRVYFTSVCILEEKKNNRNVNRQICPFERGHSLFDCPFSFQRKTNRAAELAAPVTDSRSAGGNAAVMVLSGPRPCYCFFPGPQVPGRGIACAARQPRIWLTNIRSFMVIFCTQLCKRHFPLWQIAPPLPLITLWGFANFQTLFCLLGFEERQGGKE